MTQSLLYLSMVLNLFLLVALVKSYTDINDDKKK